MKVGKDYYIIFRLFLKREDRDDFKNFGYMYSSVFIYARGFFLIPKEDKDAIKWFRENLKEKLYLPFPSSMYIPTRYFISVPKNIRLRNYEIIRVPSLFSGTYSRYQKVFDLSSCSGFYIDSLMTLLRKYKARVRYQRP